LVSRTGEGTVEDRRRNYGGPEEELWWTGGGTMEDRRRNYGLTIEIISNRINK